MGDLALGASAMKISAPLPVGGPGAELHLVGAIDLRTLFDLANFGELN
jgi:hypothetical protein